MVRPRVTLGAGPLDPSGSPHVHHPARSPVQVVNLAFSPDGSRIASGGHDGTVRVWHASTGESLTVFKGHTEPVGALDFAPSGREILSAGRDKRVFIWANPK